MIKEAESSKADLENKIAKLEEQRTACKRVREETVRFQLKMQQYNKARQRLGVGAEEVEQTIR